jgi:tetratricopeptide (TPR) repeat protein
MRYIFCLIAALCVTSIGYCQTERERQMGTHLLRGEFAAARGIADELIVENPDNALPYGTIGRLMIWTAKYDSSAYYLTRAITLDSNSTYISGWSHAELGVAYIHTGRKEDGIAELKKAIRMHSTANSTEYARHILDSIGHKEKRVKHDKNYQPDWVKIEKEHITYNFQDTSDLTSFVHKYMRVHEEAYEYLNTVFEPNLPRKVVLYVWNDRELAKKVLHSSLGFTKPVQCFSHLLNNQTVGHELTHTFAYWAWGSPTQKSTRFINEGVAVCFDLSKADKYKLAQKVVEHNKVTDILELWENGDKWDSEVLYPLGGAFVTYLYKNSTPEEFRSVIKDQTLEHARAVFGARFSTLISGFNQVVGIP